MPTGYTAAIKDGIDFKTFALDCARAFGACVMLRDEPAGGDKIPEAFEPSDYHLKALEKVRIDMGALDAMTPEELEAAAAKKYRESEDRRIARRREILALREAYEAMLAKVNAWTPPTADHAGLQEFMRTQIEESIEFDCDTDYYDKPTAQLTGAAWAAERQAKLRADAEYHKKGHEDEVKRAAGRTEWIRALRASL